MAYASQTMNKVWKTAEEMGYSNNFHDRETAGIIDDHYFIKTIAAIPTIDIINRPQGQRFGKYWHTHDDNMEVISKRTLGAVSNVILTVLYNENVGMF